MIKFLVDSASDCGKNLGLYDYFVPMTITIGEREYRDGVDLDAERFYELLMREKEFPKTSQPSPQVFLEHFQKVKEAGDELICFCVSSALSGTYQSACMAKELAEYEKIHLIDTRGATHMIGILVEHAAYLRARGRSAAHIVEAVEALIPRVKVLAGVDTLEYLRKGGRIGGAAAFVGSMAQIKPVLTVSQGVVEVQGKAIGKTRAMQQIVEKTVELEPDGEFGVYSLYSCGEENCALLEKRLEDAGISVIGRRQIGSTIGTHTGPGVYGVIFVTK